MKEFREGKAVITAAAGKLSRQMNVFYNPAMERNRSLTILLLNQLPLRQMRIADPLAGSGIRAIRLALELRKGKIGSIHCNDASAAAAAAMRKNLRKNKVAATVENKEANMFLLSHRDFDYIDIDPFGYPGHFLGAAARKIRRHGVLGITATDTAALAGTAPAACRRKYWAEPVRNEQMHETGLRILIRFCQLQGAMHEKALVPLLSYAHQHYYRVFFQCRKGNAAVDAVLRQHQALAFGKETAGPLWTGTLGESELIAGMAKKAAGKEQQFLETLAAEYAIPAVGFYDLAALGRQHKLPQQQLGKVIAALQKQGAQAARTHFSGQGIRSNASLRQIVRVLKAKGL